MSLRNWTTLGALLLVCGFSQVATAQVNPTLPAPKNAKADAPLAAQQNTEATWRDVLVELQQLRGELQTLQSNVSALQQNMDAVQDGFGKQMDINEKLQKQLDELSNRVEVIAVGGSGSSASGTSFVRSIQDDPKFANDFQKVIQGKIIFDNQTGEAQRIFINGAEWEVITGSSSVMVPFGQVTFHTRATNDGSLKPFTASAWSKQGDLMVLKVPLLLTPTDDR